MDVRKPEFIVRVLGGEYDAYDDNVDVEVTLDTGRKFSGTFFTVKNVETLLARYGQTGECAKGLYLWAADMILVKELSEDIFRKVIEDLLVNGELENSFTSINDVGTLDSSRNEIGS